MYYSVSIGRCPLLFLKVSLKCSRKKHLEHLKYWKKVGPPGSAPSRWVLSELSEDSDGKLFFLARYNPNHVLHRLSSQPKTVQYNLRKRTHDLTLPTDVSAVTKQNFVYRMLFSDLINRF